MNNFVLSSLDLLLNSHIGILKNIVDNAAHRFEQVKVCFLNIFFFFCTET